MSITTHSAARLTALALGSGCDVQDGVAADQVALVAEDGLAEIVELDTPTMLAVDQAEPAAGCPDPEADDVNYVAEDIEVCATVSVLCLDGWDSIPVACGCGCFRTEPINNYAAESAVSEADRPTDVLITIDPTHGDDGADGVLASGTVIVEPPCFADDCDPDDLAAE